MPAKDLEAYAEAVGEVSDRIDRGEIREGDLGREEVWAQVRGRLLRVAERGKAAGNFDEALVMVVDDEDRSWGPRRYSAGGR